MLKRKKIVRILSALVLIALLWVVFLVIQGLFERKISHHELFIPENAESVLEIKSEALVRTFVEDILAEGALDESFNNYVKPSEEGVEPLGIDFLSNCYIFTLPAENDVITGVLINVLNENQFKIAMDQGIESGFGCAVQDGVGLMLFQSGSNLKSSKELSFDAQKMIKKQTKFDLALLKPTLEDSKVNYWTKQYIFNERKTFRNVHLSMTVEGNELNLKGDASFVSSVTRSYPVLEQKDLSIQTQFIPNRLNELWMRNMENLGLPFPKLTYVSGNYHYSEPAPISDMKVLPNFDGIYAFEKNFQIRIPLIALAASKKINSLNLQSFKIGDKKIYYKQIDQKTIYLGQSPYKASTKEQNALLQVDGDLKQLLEIRNGGIVERFLQYSPEYNAAKRFLSNIQSSNFYIKEKEGDKVDLLGEITFEDGKSALNETTVLLMGLGGV
ncbi:MAG: hypothetical protein P8P74_01655 [Crocinitomicaceae bacterium]|nr:hypothetical protein [Crocinitomicaceae bacterium]